MSCLATTTFDFNAIKAENDTLQTDAHDDGDDYDPQRFSANAVLTTEAQAELEQARKEAEEAERILAEMEAGLDEHNEELAKEEEQWLATTSKPEPELSLTNCIVGKSLWEKGDGDGEEENLEHGKVSLPVIEPKKKEEEKSAWDALFKPADLEDIQKDPEAETGEESPEVNTKDAVDETAVEGPAVDTDTVLKENKSVAGANMESEAVQETEGVQGSAGSQDAPYKYEGEEKYDWAAERRKLLAKNRKKSVRRSKSMKKPSEAGEETEGKKKRTGVRRSKSIV